MLVAAPTATAQRSFGTFFPGQAIDGPSADVRSVGDVDIARDGSGIVTWVRRDGGEDHVFASLIQGGVAQGAFRVDGGQAPVIGQPSAAVGNGGRMVIVFANGSGVWATVRAGGGQAFAPPQQLGAAGARDPSVDLSIQGVGYVVWTENDDIRSAHMGRGQTSFLGHPVVLDAEPTNITGRGPALRPRVSAASDGLALAVWGEVDTAGYRHVVARRLVRDRVSAVSADANAPIIDGLAGGSADTPDVSFEDDSSYAWVVFRQEAVGPGGTVTRAIARRLRGSAFDGATTIDAGAQLPAHAVPRIGLNGRGQGIATVEAPGSTLASVVKDDVMTPASSIGAASGAFAAQPVAGFAENFDGVVAWMQEAPGGGAEVRGRLLEDDIGLLQVPPFGADARLSDPALGGVDPEGGIDSDVTRAGDAVIAFIQEDASGRRLMLAAYDRSPGVPSPTSSTGWRRSTLPDLAWRPAFDVWGGVTYSVTLDGQPLGTTTDTRFTSLTPMSDGIHSWQVTATDARGQVTRGPTRNLRIDGTSPELAVKVSGKRTAGKQLKFAVRASDPQEPRGSGIRQVRIDFRDGTLPRKTKSAFPTFAHVFASKGTFRVRISTLDRAGNSAVVYADVKVKAPPKKKKKSKKRKKPVKKPAPKTPTTEPEIPPEPVPEEPPPDVAPGEPAPDPGGTGAGPARRR